MRGLLELERRQVIRPLRGSVGPWLNLELELDPRVREYCFGASPRVALPLGIVSARVRESLKQAAQLSESRQGQVLVLLRGRRGSGRDTALGVLLKLVDAFPLHRDVGSLRAEDDPLEPELSGAVAVWDARGIDVSPEDLHRAARFLSRSPTLAIALLDPHQDAPELPERAQVGVRCDAEDASERSALWSAALEGASEQLSLTHAPQLVHAEILASVPRRLATRNRAGIGLARRALAALPSRRDPPAVNSLTADLERQLQQLVQPSSTRGITVEQPNATLEQLVVAPVIRASLDQLLALVSASELAPDPRRTGVKALFSGPPGTGKTLAARALASHLSLPLFRVDLSSLVSKWLGETEK
ncbi:MAG: ATP-binding protein, partial [Myxococcales bacterium]|nr:ATP-binding protein [Myxococcales bacterium]